MTDDLDDSDDRSPPAKPVEEPGPPTDTCNAETADGTPCRNAAGYKTWHVGEGRCTYHGGGPANPEDDGRIRHGLDSDIAQTEDGARLAELLEDSSPTDSMRATLAMSRLVAERFLTQHVVSRDEVEPEKLKMAQAILDRANLCAVRLSKSLARRSATPKKIEAVVGLVVQAVERHADESTAASVARDLQGEVIKAEIVED